MIGFIRHVLAYRRLKKQSWKTHECDIEGYGVVHIRQMDIPMRLALTTALSDDSADTFSIYLWLVAACVQELYGIAAEKIGFDIAPDAIVRMGDAVLDCSGMNKATKENDEKKSEAVQS